MLAVAFSSQEENLNGAKKETGPCLQAKLSCTSKESGLRANSDSSSPRLSQMQPRIPFVSNINAERLRYCLDIKPVSRRETGRDPWTSRGAILWYQPSSANNHSVLQSYQRKNLCYFNYLLCLEDCCPIYYVALGPTDDGHVRATFWTSLSVDSYAEINLSISGLLTPFATHFWDILQRLAHAHVR